MPDKYQNRYLEHQSRKKQTLEQNLGEKNFAKSHNFLTIIRERRSQRIFNKKPITADQWKLIDKAVVLSPSSCNRQAINIQKVSPESKFLDLLVGGTNWIKNANKVILVYANMEAYKSPNEVDFMPYLDAGFISQNIYLMCEYLGIGCCFVNPNLREKKAFDRNSYKFMGAIAIGNYDKKSIKPPKRKTSWKKIID